MPLFGTGPKRTDGRTNSLINATPTYLTPTQVPNLAVWFDASDTSTITTNISSLNQWFSKTPIPYLMSNTSGLPGPVWVSTTQNGLGVMRFRANNNSYMSTSQWYNTTNFVTNNETTMFLAYNPTNNGAPFGIQDSQYGNSLRIYPQSGQTWFCGVLYNLPNNGSLQFSYPVNTGFKVESYFARQSTLGARMNGSLLAQSTMATGLSFPAGVDKFVQMGAQSYNSRFFTQDIGEALIYNRGLSDYELQGVEAYLARKWGTQSALPYRHPGLPTGPPLLGYRLITYPRLVANYGLWYDAMDTSTIKDVGGNFPPLLPPNALGVAQWNDKSGNNRHLTNSIGNIRFNLLGNNFYPEVSPNSDYAGLYYPISPQVYIGCNISAFFVLRVTNPNFSPLLAFTSSFNAMPNPVTGNPLIVNSNSTFDFTLVYNGSNVGLNRFGANTANSVVQAPYFGSTALIQLQVNGTQNTIGNVLPSTNMISINGAFVSSSSFYAGNNFNFQFLSLFGGYNFRAPGFAMSLNEVAVFFRTLTTPERLLIENQLLNKWKLPSNAPVSFINSLPVTSGLFGWYDAYDQTTVLRNSSNNVSMWLDKSGQSNHMSTNLLTYGSNTRSNIYYSSISISTNSFPSLFFPSTFAFMQTSSLITNQSLSTFTMMAVTRGTKIPINTNRTVTFFSTLNDLERAGATLGVPNDQVANTNITVNQNSSNYSTFHINTLLANIGPTTDTGIASGNAVTYFNGSNSNLGTGLIYNGMLTPSYIRLMASAFTDEVNGDPRTDAGYLGEVLMYNRILNTTELTNVHSYLLNKWNISTLVSNVPVVRGLNLWLDAYDPATVIFSTNTNLVQQWRDKSISTLHFSNALTSGYVRPPTYTINPANNLPGLLFSNNNPTNTYVTGIYNCNFNYPVTKEATIFTVAQWSSGNSSYYSPVFCMLSNNEFVNTNANNFIVVGFGYGTNLGLYRASPGGFLNSIGNTLDRPTLVTGVFNSSFSTTLIVDIPQNHVALGRNGVIGATNISSFISTIGNGAVSATDFNVNQAVLGLRAPSGGDATWDHAGYIHEVLLYNRTLSFVERQQVESYLLSKWYI
jgi:hypothetical protein